MLHDGLYADCNQNYSADERGFCAEKHSKAPAAKHTEKAEEKRDNAYYRRRKEYLFARCCKAHADNQCVNACNNCLQKN